jgi:hypothetical protein
VSQQIPVAALALGLALSAPGYGLLALRAPGRGLQATGERENPKVEARRPKSEAHSREPEARRPYVPPRTPWGDPDIQGMWPSGSMTGVPFERPESLGDRSELTDEEFSRREKAVEVQRTGSFVIGAWGEPGRAQRQTSLIVEPRNGRLPPMTPEGERRSRFLRSSWQDIWFDNVSDLDTWDRCITRGLLPSMLPAQYSNGIQIHQSPGYVVIRNEMIHENRIIPLDGRPHVGARITSYMGDSRGHWEGTTLVVETTNFNGRTAATNPGTTGSPQQNNIPTSEQMNIVERLTRTSPDTIQYEATVRDPVVFVAPYKVSYPLKYEPDYQLFEYSCHDGNYALKNLITGSQAELAALRKTGE